MRRSRIVALLIALAAAVPAAVLAGPTSAEAASSSTSCLHEHVSGRTRTETLPGAASTTVSVKSRRCFDRQELWKSHRTDPDEYLSAERFLCDRLGVERDLHHVLGHGVLSAAPVMSGGFVRGKNCTWMLPFAKWRTPSEVALEGITVSVLGASDSGGSQYADAVRLAADVDGTRVQHTTVAGRPAAVVRSGEYGLRHGTELLVSGPQRSTIVVREQVSDEHPAIRTALRSRLRHIAARAVHVAKTLNTGPLE